jgi:hypothetical protein
MVKIQRDKSNGFFKGYFMWQKGTKNMNLKGVAKFMVCWINEGACIYLAITNS